MKPTSRILMVFTLTACASASFADGIVNDRLSASGATQRLPGDQFGKVRR